MSSAADTPAAFYQNLQASRLLTDAQLRDLWGWIAHARPDLQAAAKEVSRRGWLTPYQIREIARGRGGALQVAGRYVLLDVLGEGGMGRVYKVHDARMGRLAALKVIRKEKLSHPLARQRFEQEIRALSAMDHPNVVKVYDAEEAAGHHFYVMEFIDGADLTKLVRDAGPLPLPAACDAVRQAALGLQHASERGLVHRDIKPSNILVPRNGGAVKLVDLGLARLLEPPGGEDAHRLTQEGFVIGTPDFLAPEQARNPMAVDIRADIYSLGGTLYYILTGRVPYDGANPTEKMLKHCTDPPPPLLPHRPDAPPQLEQLLHWCMAKRAEDRPQTPVQLAHALQPFCPPPVAGAGAYAPGGGAYRPYPPPAPLPLPDPSPSSQVFKLPSHAAADDPIRKRGEAGFPVGIVLVALGALFVVAVLGFATYRIFRTPADTVPEPFTNTQGMKMVRLDGGTFRMGSPDDEVGRAADEGPVREVTVAGPFFVSATEVTNGQYLKVIGTSPSRAAKIAARPDTLPVDSATWEDANDFCRKLTEREKGQDWARKGWAYRLPTEAEWEYAARAGTDTPFAFGAHAVFLDQATYLMTNDDPLEKAAEDAPKKPLPFAQPAGKTAPNPFGLYDMHGNVAEWCRDWYKPEAYKDAAADNPTGPADGDKRVVRGGSFDQPAARARSAARAGVRPTDRHLHVGFRVVYAPVR